MTLISMCCMKLRAWEVTTCILYGDYVRDWTEDESFFDIPVLQGSQNGSGTHPGSYSVGTVVLSLGSVAAEVES
jgi:hypothetical protein